MRIQLERLLAVFLFPLGPVTPGIGNQFFVVLFFWSRFF